MPDAYEVFEGRYLQSTVVTSAANADDVPVGPVPAGKVWTILAASGFVSVGETQDYWFSIWKSGYPCRFHVTLPVEFVMAPAVNHDFTMVREGMELKLFPGEYLYFARDAHTAGSTMSIGIRFIESDLQYYRYVEPHAQVPSKRQAHGSSFRAPTSGSGGSPAAAVIERGGKSGGGRGELI